MVPVVCGACGSVIHVATEALAASATLSCNACKAPIRLRESTFGVSSEQAALMAEPAPTAPTHSEFPLR